MSQSMRLMPNILSTPGHDVTPIIVRKVLHTGHLITLLCDMAQGFHTQKLRLTVDQVER